jgi:integrase
MSFLYDRQGGRKYVNGIERARFIEVSRLFPVEVQTFCMTLAISGARISEVLALAPLRFDFVEQSIRIECLKKRRRHVFRDVPVPPSFLDWLDGVHHITAAQRNPSTARQLLWPWCRTTAWKRVKAVMAAADICGTQACPKGLRHGFGVGTIQAPVPETMVQKWLGHAHLSTTAIYTNAVGPEERALAARFWDTFPNLNRE